MKRFIILVLGLLIVTLTGCTLPWDKEKDKEFEPVEVSISGTVVDVQPVSVLNNSDDASEENSMLNYNAVMITGSDQTTYSVYFSTDISVDDLHTDTQVNLVAYTVENEEYLQASSFEITYQPTQYVAGITAEELISRPANHDKQMSHVDYVMISDLDYKSDGMLEHTQSKSQTIRSDSYSRRHISANKNVIKGKNVNQSSVNEYYVTSNDGLKTYFNDNYTGWYYKDLDGEYTMSPDFTFKHDDVTVTEYLIDDKGRLVVKGDWNINESNFVGDGIIQLISTYGIKKEDISSTFTAVYDKETFDLYNIQVNVTSMSDGIYEGTTAKIKELTATVYGIEYDKETVTIPASVKESAIDSYYIDNPLKDVPELDVTSLLCRVFLNTDKATLAMIKEYTQLDEEKSMFNWNLEVDEICDSIKYWINNYNTEQFMEAYVKFKGDEEYSKSAAASVVYTWLQKYNIKIDDYKEVPTE